MLSEDEGKAKQVLALYTAAFGAEFRIELKIVAAGDAKFRLRPKCLSVKRHHLGWSHCFSGRRFGSLVHIGDSTAWLERVIDVWH
jgi:hypothetical protein